jgi:hypothetical protein
MSSRFAHMPIWREMPRITLRDVLVTGGATAFAAALLAADVRHAGWYIAVAIFLAGLALGVRAVAAVFAVAVAFAIGWVIWGTIHPIDDPDGDGRAYAALFATLFPAMASVPALAGAVVRWVYLRQRGEAPALRLPSVQSPAAMFLVLFVAIAGMLVWGFWVAVAAVAFVLVAATRPRAL